MLHPIQVLLPVVEVILKWAVTVVAEVALPHADSTKRTFGRKIKYNLSTQLSRTYHPSLFHCASLHQVACNFHETGSFLKVLWHSHLHTCKGSRHDYQTMYTLWRVSPIECSGTNFQVHTTCLLNHCAAHSNKYYLPYFIPPQRQGTRYGVYTSISPSILSYRQLCQVD